MRYDVEPVKHAANGRWHEILTHAGIDPSYLTGNNGPCPICREGRDRWRWTNLDGNGGGACTRHANPGDGIALIQQVKGIGFPEALKLVGDYLGVAKTKKRSKPTAGKPMKPASKKPAKKTTGKKDRPFPINWCPWSDKAAKIWARSKGLDPSCVDVLQREGAMIGEYRFGKRKYSVFCLPGWDSETDQQGWAIYEITGGLLPDWDHEKQAPVMRLKVKLIKHPDSSLRNVKK